MRSTGFTGHARDATFEGRGSMTTVLYPVNGLIGHNNKCDLYHGCRYAIETGNI
ncbi:hypothetical protein FHX37_1736 [Haloactinospora alba]|uniref:Uncharacterized protein n=1 Tax=Haloactinospora alba TaxID=405555 RepID=A0A543NIZ1_9ACTN|nr:hypothetical protein FHX37_1736 [Haloactinospora alba]